MRVMFVSITKGGYAWSSIGIMQLSAILKENGHDCRNLLSTDKDLLKRIVQYSPGIVAISCMTQTLNIALKTAKMIKDSLEVPIVFGGPHPTFCPEIINEDCVDIICRGEGDYAFLELVNKIEQGKDITTIKNLWVKSRGKIHRNPLRPLIDDIDSLPFPDRELLKDNYSTFPRMTFNASRGCPYNCSYCFNHNMKQMYKNKGTYVRRRSVDNLIEEIRLNVKEYRLKTVHFSDDTFTLNKRWSMEFCERYGQEIGLPFTITTRADCVDDEVARNLKGAGCYRVNIGMESGSEVIRNRILKKDLKNSDIENCCMLLRKNGIEIMTFNLFGIPGTTIEDDIETIEFNLKIRPDYARFMLFEPYPKLELTGLALKSGYIAKSDITRPDFDMSQYSLISRHPELNNMRLLAHLYVRHPIFFRLNRFLVEKRVARNMLVNFLLWLYLIGLERKIYSLSLTSIIRTPSSLIRALGYRKGI